MNYWHMQLHGNKKEYSRNDILQLLENKKIIGMGESWENDRGQPEKFKNKLAKGDIILIRHGGGPLALVQVIGDLKKNDDKDVWFDIIRKIKVLETYKSDKIKKQYKEKYNENWQENMYCSLTFEIANNSNFIKFCHNLVKMKTIKNLLKTNKNLILTGAPGTGKTYLAKEIAEDITGTKFDDKENNQIEFIQFHPSFDYTDFVEGLRPVKNGKNDDEIKFELKDGFFKAFCKKAAKDDKNYVFIIDEINRADISNVFGELFFSIDADYRGPENKTKTQYSNLLDEDDLFYAGFYVPENVYIIGTMNDIDRSVESFDFAIRRRFAWKEIEPSERDWMINEEIKDDNIAKEAKDRMNTLNEAIRGINELGKDYQIGPAYFLKLKNYINDDSGENHFESLWDYHLKPLIKEYLRGLPGAKDKIDELAEAFGIPKNENQ